MHLTDWFDKHSGAVQAASSILIVFLTVAYILYNRALAQEATETRRAQDNPYLLLTLREESTTAVSAGSEYVPARFSVEVWNGGRGPSKNVVVTFRSGWADYQSSALAFVGTGDRVPVELHVRRTDSAARDPSSARLIVTYDDLFDAKWESVLEVSWTVSTEDGATVANMLPGAFRVKRLKR